MKQQTNDDSQSKDQQQEDVAAVQTPSEADVWKEKYVRALADYQNLQKRTQDELQEFRSFAGLAFLEKLLPVVDLLEKAAEHLKDQGLELALKELYAFFHSMGVEKIDVVGKPFDPYAMDCIEIVEDGKENTVVSVLSAGYRMHGKLVRPAKVTVGKKKEGNQ